MALTKCPECGKEGVSDTAVSCPQCGYNIKAYYEAEKKKALIQEKEKERLAKKPKEIPLYVKLIIGAIIILGIIVGVVLVNKYKAYKDCISFTENGLAKIESIDRDIISLKKDDGTEISDFEFELINKRYFKKNGDWNPENLGYSYIVTADEYWMINFYCDCIKNFYEKLDARQKQKYLGYLIDNHQTTYDLIMQKFTEMGVNGHTYDEALENALKEYRLKMINEMYY